MSGDAKAKAPPVLELHVSLHAADKCPARRAVRAVGDELVARACDAARSDKSGPSKVATEAYRSGWDTIFGKRADAGKA